MDDSPAAQGDDRPLISYGKQSIDQSDVQALLGTLQSDYLTQGPAVAAFEDELARICGAKFAVAYANGTAALHGAYFAAGLSTGDEFLCTANTFAATANAGLYLGAKPIFVDVEPETGNIDFQDLKQKLTPKTKLIAPVDFAGQPVDLDEIMAFAKEHNLLVVEDACHALGASYKNKAIGSIADMTVFSFHPIKSITTGEGGAVLTNDPALAEKLRSFRTHGIHKPDRWSQDMTLLGYNYRLSDLHAALGSSQLQRLSSFIQKRQTIADRYNSELTEPLQKPLIKSDRHSSWHLYPVRLPAELVPQKTDILNELLTHKIACQVHYPPVYLHSYYKAQGITAHCPNAEAYFESEISLPIYPDLSPEDQSYVIETLNKIIKDRL